MNNPAFRSDLQVGADGRIRPIEPRLTSASIVPLPKVDTTDLLGSAKVSDAWLNETDDSAVQSLANVHKSLAGLFNHAMTLREKFDPAVTQAQHLRSFSTEFNNNLSIAAQREIQAQNNAKSRLQEIESDFRKAVNWSSQDSQEIRQVVRGMKPNERSEFIQSAIANADGQVIAAILGAHHSLSGIDKSQHEALRGQAMHRHTPNLLKAEKAILKASAATQKALMQLVDRQDALTAKQVRDKYDADAKAAAAAKEKAQAAGFWG